MKAVLLSLAALIVINCVSDLPYVKQDIAIVEVRNA